MRNIIYSSILILLVAGTTSAETLHETLQARAAASQKKTPAETRKTMAAATAGLAESGILNQTPAIGSTLPDGSFILPNGHSTTLYKQLSGKPAIVTFYRGGWCPYCNIQLHAYQQYLPKITAAGGTLIAISPELPDNTLTTSQKNELDYAVLSDQDNNYARQLGIVFSIGTELKKVYQNFGIDLEKNQGNDSWNLPLAATFVIDTNHIVRYAFVDVDYRKRAEPAELIAALQSLKE